LILISPIQIWCQTLKIWLWKDWAKWHNWQRSQGNSHQQTRNQLWTPEGAKNFLREAQILHLYGRKQWLCVQYVQDIFSGEVKVFPKGRSPPLVTDLVTRWSDMQTSHCRLDWYMCMYSERLLVRFLLDYLKSSLVGLDNFAWEFDWCLERILDKRCLDNRKGTQQHARADKGRLKGQILRPSAVKINCKSFCEVAYANLAKHVLLL